MVCNGGVYMFTLLDWHTGSWSVLLLGAAEVYLVDVQKWKDKQSNFLRLW